MMTPAKVQSPVTTYKEKAENSVDMTDKELIHMRVRSSVSHASNKLLASEVFFKFLNDFSAIL